MYFGIHFHNAFRCPETFKLFKFQLSRVLPQHFTLKFKRKQYDPIDGLDTVNKYHFKSSIQSQSPSVLRKSLCFYLLRPSNVTQQAERQPQDLLRLSNT